MVKQHKSYGRPNEVILWEGPCAYVLRIGQCHHVMVHSTNYVTHKPAGTTEHEDIAKRTCDGLNRYPRQTREAYDLL